LYITHMHPLTRGLAFSLFLWQTASAEGLWENSGLNGEQQGTLVAFWLIYLLALSHGKYLYGSPLDGGTAIKGIALWLGGGAGCLLMSAAFNTTLLQIIAPILYLFGTYAMVNQFVPYKYR
jgi:hypothetical protein